MEMQPHEPVLLNEILSLLKGEELFKFVDGTLGAGGHAFHILTNHPEIEQFIGIDQDRSALEIAKKRLAPFKEKCTFLHQNFSEIDNSLVDGILLDIGVSSMQLDLPNRGFSFQKKGPLDMRMDTSKPFSAKELVNEYSEEELGRVFREGEERRWRSCASAITQAREKKPIETTEELVEILRPVTWKKKGLDPLTLAFQSIRIEVNGELLRLKEVIPKAIEKLNSGGLLLIISFHRLEDRIVKRAFRDAASKTEVIEGKREQIILPKEPQVELVTKRPLDAAEEEIAKNPRSRSAKLRAVRKL